MEETWRQAFALFAETARTVKVANDATRVRLEERAFLMPVVLQSARSQRHVKSDDLLYVIEIIVMVILSIMVGLLYAAVLTLQDDMNNHGWSSGYLWLFGVSTGPYPKLLIDIVSYVLLFHLTWDVVAIGGRYWNAVMLHMGWPMRQWPYLMMRLLPYLPMPVDDWLQNGARQDPLLFVDQLLTRPEVTAGAVYLFQFLPRPEDVYTVDMEAIDAFVQHWERTGGATFNAAIVFSRERVRTLWLMIAADTVHFPTVVQRQAALLWLLFMHETDASPARRPAPLSSLDAKWEANNLSAMLLKRVS